MQNASVRADGRGQEENHCQAYGRVKAELRLKMCGAAARVSRACALLLLLSLHGCHTQEGALKNNEPAATPHAGGQSADNALTIHRRAVSVDMHADTVQFIIDKGADINRRLTTTQLDAPRMRDGGLDAQFFSIWVEPQFYGRGGASSCVVVSRRLMSAPSSIMNCTVSACMSTATARRCMASASSALWPPARGAADD